VLPRRPAARGGRRGSRDGHVQERRPRDHHAGDRAPPRAAPARPGRIVVGRPLTGRTTMPVAIGLDEVDALTPDWWVFLIRGLLAMAFGLVTFFDPGISLAVLVLVFGAYAFADGIFAIASAIRRHTGSKPWWLLLLEGIAGVAAGIITLLWPGLTA